MFEPTQRLRFPYNRHMSDAPVNCTVYKSLRKDQTYVFVPAGSDLDELPDMLKTLLGELEKVLDVELTPERPLARAEASEVMQQIAESGFYVQMPPGKDDDLFADANTPAAAPEHAA